MRVSELEFTDLLVHRQPAESVFKERPSMSPRPLPELAWPDIANMRQEMDRLDPRPSFRFVHDGVSYRAERMETGDGLVYALRRLVPVISSVEELGLPPAVVRALLSENLHYGLVLFTGATGAGKSTAASAVLVERLKLYGGLAWTVENPLEIHLQGMYGDKGGRCYQLEARSDDDFGRLVASCLRASAPQYIMIGEIRESSAAAQALRAAASGHIVIATMHGSDIIPSLERLASLGRVYEGSAAQVLLADSVAAVLHLNLRFIPQTNGAPPRRNLEVKCLIAEGAGVREKIRRGEMHKLANDVEQQRNRMINGIRVEVG